MMHSPLEQELVPGSCTVPHPRLIKDGLTMAPTTRRHLVVVLLSNTPVTHMAQQPQLVEANQVKY